MKKTKITAKHIEVLQAILALQGQGMRRVGKRLVETRLNRNLNAKTFSGLMEQGLLLGNSELGWSLSEAGKRIVLERGRP